MDTTTTTTFGKIDDGTNTRWFVDHPVRPYMVSWFGTNGPFFDEFEDDAPRAFSVRIAMARSGDHHLVELAQCASRDELQKIIDFMDGI